MIEQFELAQEKINHINFSIVNNALACSTLTFGNFPQKYGSYNYPIHPITGQPGDNEIPDGTFERFLEDIKKGMKLFWDAQVSRRQWNAQRFQNMSAVFASVRKEQGLVSQYLDKLGFTGSPWVHNIKNDSDVRVFFMPVPEFLKALDDLGVDWPEKTDKKSYLTKDLNVFPPSDDDDEED